MQIRSGDWPRGQTLAKSHAQVARWRRLIIGILRRRGPNPDRMSLALSAALLIYVSNRKKLYGTAFAP